MSIATEKVIHTAFQKTLSIQNAVHKKNWTLKPGHKKTKKKNGSRNSNIVQLTLLMKFTRNIHVLDMGAQATENLRL